MGGRSFEKEIESVERTRLVHRLQRELVEHEDDSAGEDDRADLAEESLALDVLGRFLEEGRVEAARAREALQRNAMDAEVAHARARDRELRRVRRDPFRVISRPDEARESLAEADPDFEHGGRWRRELLEDQGRRALLRAGE